VQLFGHSGGGALSVLLADRISGVRGLVTIAGNLDTEAWTQLHGYSPLSGSLNPSHVELSDELARHSEHWTGGRDVLVPPQITQEAAAKIGGRVIEIDAYSHQCCWEKVWPAILADHSN
jgi:hypothetical protein